MAKFSQEVGCCRKERGGEAEALIFTYDLDSEEVVYLVACRTFLTHRHRRAGPPSVRRHNTLDRYVWGLSGESFIGLYILRLSRVAVRLCGNFCRFALPQARQPSGTEPREPKKSKNNFNRTHKARVSPPTQVLNASFSKRCGLDES